eukprot:259345-Rhodomonas_salina.1
MAGSQSDGGGRRAGRRLNRSDVAQRLYEALSLIACALSGRGGRGERDEGGESVCQLTGSADKSTWTQNGGKRNGGARAPR